MTELCFPVNGYILRAAGDDDRAYVMASMKESILLSVPGSEAELSDIWMDDILGVTSIAIDGGMMRSELFILDADGESAGLLWMGISRDQFTCEDTGYLLGLYVNGELRGKGLGRALIECAEDWCITNGLMMMTLNVGSANAADGFYRHLEFTERSKVMRKRLR
ncbi:MAG: GNAT family N-acetyltransferase [Methanomassiliicoccaceae archaeon]|nr:GNAT family N-acetyltransferase [Methanomassiliicoccaceae archaeon]